MALPSEIHPFHLAGAGQGYQVANSLRFRNSATAYLTRTASVAGNTQKWTWSAWIKRGSLGFNCGLFNGRVDGNNTTELYIKSDDTLHIVSYISNVNKGEAYTPAVLRDPSAWYHIVCAMDTTQSSFANGWAKIWINGVQQTLTVSTTAVQNINTQVNGANSHQIGSDGFGLAGSPYFDGYMAEINHIDGLALDPTYFGQTDPITGVWVPKKASGWTNYQMISSSSGTNIGDMTSGGALAASFDGIVAQAYASASQGVGSGNLTKYVGKDWGVGVTNSVGKIEVYGVTDFTGFTSSTATPTMKITLQGSTDNFSSSVVDLGNSGNFTPATYKRVTVTATDTTAYRYHRAKIEEVSGADAGSHAVLCAELQFYAVPSTGTSNYYGTNGFYLPFTPGSTSTYGATFNGSNQYLSATTGSSMIGSGDFTVEFWMKTTSVNDLRIFSLGNNNATGSLHIIYSGTYVRVNYETTGAATGTRRVSGGGWHHVALVRSSGTLKMYIDGILDVNYGSVGINFNNTRLQIGASTDIPSYFDGSISNFRITTNAVYTANFMPPSAPLTAISGTTLLTLQDSSFIDNSTNAYSLTNNGTMTSAVNYPFAASIGYDASGNINQWTPVNIEENAVTSTTYDIMRDSPTNYNDGSTYYNRGSYCVMSPLQMVPGGPTKMSTITNGGLTTSGSLTFGLGSFAIPTTGKWYWEGTVSNYSSPEWGIASNAKVQEGGTAATWCSYDTSYAYANGSAPASDGNQPAASGDVGLIAIDSDNNKMWIGRYRSGVVVWMGGGSPYTGTSPSFSAAAGGGVYSTSFNIASTNWYPLSGTYSTCTWDLNFGQRPWVNTPPTGYKALNTYNLANPSLPLV